MVATHIRLAPRVPDPDPHYDDVVADGAPSSWPTAAGGPRRPASRASGSWSTPGSTSGKTEPQSLELLRASDRLAALGYPVFLSASNKRFLGHLLGHRGRPTATRRSHAAHALGIALGCRVLRAHDVRGRPPGRRRDGRRPGGPRPVTHVPCTS